MNTAPIFVGGAGRSGTTLLRVVLDTHPHIACGPELKLIPSIAAHWENTAKHFQEILKSYQLTPAELNRSYQSFIRHLLQPFLDKSGKQRVAEKTPNNVFFFYHLHQMFPQSPLIHCIRDGRDVVCSLLTMNWINPETGKKLPYVENAENAAHYWVRSVAAGRASARNSSVKNRYHEIRYEDVVNEPEATLKELFDFLEEPWDPAVLDFHLTRRDLRAESSAQQVSQELYSYSAGRWTRDLKGEDKDTVKSIAGDLLIELGYAVDQRW